MNVERGWVDLAGRVPGQGVSDETLRRWRTEGAAGARSWQLGADGEYVAARALEELLSVSRWRRWRGARARWWILHSVPVGTGRGDIDHVLAGPGGVFTINTKHHRAGRVDIIGDELRVNRRPTDYVERAVVEARRAGRLLGAALTASGQTVLAGRLWVRPVLVIVGARLVGGGLPGGVLVDRPEGLMFRLQALPEVLDDDQLAALFEVARRSTTWTRP